MLLPAENAKIIPAGNFYCSVFEVTLIFFNQNLLIP